MQRWSWCLACSQGREPLDLPRARPWCPARQERSWMVSARARGRQYLMDTGMLFLEKAQTGMFRRWRWVFLWCLFIFLEVICTGRSHAVQCCLSSLAPAQTQLLLLPVHLHPSNWEWEVQGKARSCLPEVVLPHDPPTLSQLYPAGCLPRSCCWVFSGSDSPSYLLLR